MPCEARELFKEEVVITRIKYHEEVSKKFTFALLTRTLYQKEKQLMVWREIG